MINAIIADDEPIIIKGLKKLIPWEQHGIRIIGEAWTGRELLGLIEKEKPELVITDISMPDGNGIDVIKAIERQGLKTKVLFISAYQEFSYARDALAYGAVDYLVKPVEKSLLLSAVEKALTMLEEETKELNFKSKLAVYEHKDKKTQLEELFDRLTEGDIRLEEAKRKLQTLESGFVHPGYSVLILEAEQPDHDERWGEHEKRLLLFAITNMADELIQRNGTGVIVRKSDRLCAVVNHPDSLDIMELARDIAENVRLYLKIKLMIGIGRPAEGLEEIKTSYLTAMETLSRAFFEGESLCISWSELKRESTVTDREMNESRQQVLQALLAKNPLRLEESLQKLFQQILLYASGNKDAALMACYTSLTEWFGSLQEVGVDIRVPGDGRQDWLTVLQAFRRYEDLEHFVREKSKELLRHLESSGGGKEAQQLQMVKEYIENHFKENITLESLASMTFMNPYYFSSFFKKHTQMNFKQYLTDVRMKQAVKLLLQSDLMVYEIAEQVGYNNARQFSDMFKKHFGKLPQEYKSPK